MLNKFLNFKRWFGISRMKTDDIALNINDQYLINTFIKQSYFPWLISFPRTGSHWVRMLMELYFKKPSLVEIYYYKDAKSFTCYHQHDVQLTISGCKNVLYLYRDPVDTIYSQVCYEKINLDNTKEIYKWTELYGKHLSKWLFEEDFTTKKTVISYEGLKNDIDNEFKKICDHFGVQFDSERLEIISKKVTKEDLKRRTTHDEQVINLSNRYNENRKLFRDKYANVIISSIKKNHPSLKNYIELYNE